MLELLADLGVKVDRRDENTVSLQADDVAKTDGRRRRWPSASAPPS